jgi:GNAT superfamily N-acetyltransferase
LSVIIRRADGNDADALTTIALAAKSYWKYPETWIRQWRDQLTVTAAYTGEHRVFLIQIDDAVGGFYSLNGNGSTLELDHLWIDPAHIGRGLGRRLLEHATAQARDAGARRIEIDSDPHAESFYEHFGARGIGKTPAPMEGEPERYLPRMVLELAD